MMVILFRRLIDSDFIMSRRDLVIAVALIVVLYFTAMLSVVQNVDDQQMFF
eukprot:CAMPEP_0115032152 /NCGR_PEP_ID=MMETSP0216-20121206/38987_1 /TAXON_ID=223996 /ORGANISM="Protocruzia adherens, Strain Boccale" /LENGTH=50 /DNA_ID=CAMNT_0002409995 /DNA_START=518 /DNA_END=667 /DNA_ORIENTATION=+